MVRSYFQDSHWTRKTSAHSPFLCHVHQRGSSANSYARKPRKARPVHPCPLHPSTSIDIQQQAKLQSFKFVQFSPATPGLWMWYSTTASPSISKSMGRRRPWNSSQSTGPNLLSWQSRFTSAPHCLKAARPPEASCIRLRVGNGQVLGWQTKSQSSMFGIPNSSSTWTWHLFFCGENA